MRIRDRWLAGLFAGTALVISTPSAPIGDADREKQVAERLANDIENGDVVWLRPLFGRKFPALFESAGPYARPRAIILLHGMGGHPDWPYVISPLRQYLHAQHWTTLSIQLPVLAAGRPASDYGRTLKEATRRINAAIQYLDDRYYHRVILIGYGFGAATAMHSVVTEKLPAVDGIAGISMLARKFLDPGIDLVELLRQIPVAVLDVYASRDKPAVINSADDRRLAGLQNNCIAYEQFVIEDTDTYYSGREDLLFAHITRWLDRPGLQTDPETETGDTAAAAGGAVK